MRAGRASSGRLAGLACLAAVLAATSAPAQTGGIEAAATNEFEYSYSTDTRREIVENWLDASVLLGELRAGFLLNARQPSEEGERSNTVRHRFVEFARGGLEVRAGHFYGLFGRGLVFAAYEDRRIRVDTALDGLLVGARRGRWRVTAFTGAPLVLPRDVRGLDGEIDLGRGLTAGASGLTYQADDLATADGSVHREWVAAPRLSWLLPFGDCYFEYGWKKGWDFEPTPDDAYHRGRAFYGGVNLFAGPVALALEGKDYHRFTVLRRADGRAALNNPPSLSREHLYTLLNRAPHDVDADDERGLQAELTARGPGDVGLLLNASRTQRRDGRLLFEEVYGQLEREAGDGWRMRGAFGYRDSEGLRQVGVGEIVWRATPRSSLGLTIEHQHVRMGGGPGFDLGAYDEQFLKLEYGRAPSWTVAGVLEMNNKYAEQRAFGEKAGPFPALQIAHATREGARLSLWAGKRQAGYLCAGGVCKFEPAFEGVELTGTLRY